MEFNNFLDYQPLSDHNEDIHHVLDQWSRAAFLESHVATPIHANCLDDIEHIYAGLHKCVDQVVAKISVRTPPRLDQIREQNRKLIDKLTTVECTITGDTTAVILGSGSPVRPSAPAPDLARVRSGCKRRRVSQSTGPGTESASIPNTRSVSPFSMPEIRTYIASGSQLNQSHGHGSPSFGGLKGDSMLAKKLLQIGNQEARTQFAEFAAQLKAPKCQNALPNMYQFSNVSQITDVSHFLRLVLDLGLAIESSIFGEQTSRIRKRIALAHFYHAYTLAQDNPEIFLSWCDNQRLQGGSMLPKAGNKSVVQHRFADLIFSQALNHEGMPSARPFDHGYDAKRKAAKIQMWRKSGKKWAQIIQCFGYGILLLLPPSLSDEE
ncbi:hypothetical protein K432DRAFT_308682 [Lepidopterella palustris CBS 459.81]|uniref:Uncharacterized protein n=1 Tax=Lepidopterella palustris CBS 459.81 TaxID=1314670 RepID=A0A8E2E1B9_9PEZI|nr:hypothetical protein K432DRAFT_308682 [Lepidopterella palustris CBS 459.81]